MSSSNQNGGATINGDGSGGPNFTPTEARLMAVLGDGFPHKWEELWEALEDPEATNLNLNNFFTPLRKKLRPRGIDIHYSVHLGQRYYALVRTVASPYR